VHSWKHAVVIALVLHLTALLAAGTTDCYSTINNTKGPNAMSYCITATGNVLQIKGSGLNQLGNYEGYIIVDNDHSISYSDLATTSSHLSDPVIVQPNGPNTFPLKITRQATAGPMITLEQTFQKNSDPSILIINMKITLWQDYPVGNYQIIRVADVVADQDPANTIVTQGRYSVLASKPNGHGLMLTGIGNLGGYTYLNEVECMGGTSICLNYGVHLPSHEWRYGCCEAWGASRTVTFEYKLF
jgi:hypothetical protein